jgi:hypothetical protein
MKLGELRAGESISIDLLAHRMALAPTALAKLEETPLDRCTVGLLKAYVRALGAHIELAFPGKRKMMGSASADE